MAPKDWSYQLSNRQQRFLASLSKKFIISLSQMASVGPGAVSLIHRWAKNESCYQEGRSLTLWVFVHTGPYFCTHLYHEHRLQGP